MTSDHVVDDIFGRLDDAAAHRETVSLETVLESFGRRAYGPLLFVIGVLTVSPLGAIPGATVFFATITLLLVVQYALRDTPPWVPATLKKRTVGANRIASALRRMRPYAKRLDAVLRQRNVSLTERPWSYLWAFVMFMLAIILYPLALVPGGAAAPGTMLALMGVAITARDGLALAVTGAVGGLMALGIALLVV